MAQVGRSMYELSSGWLSSRVGTTHPRGGHGAVVPLEGPGEDLAWAVVGGHFDSKSVTGWLAIREVQVVLVAPRESECPAR